MISLTMKCVHVCIYMCVHAVQVITPRPGHEHQLLGAEVMVQDGDKPVQALLNMFRTPEAKYTLELAPLLSRVPQPTLRITDTILYNGDLVALTRIKYLFDVVDEFIIVESWVTFSGQVKPQLYFHEPDTYAQFLPFMHKIKYVVIKFIPDVPPSFKGPVSSVGTLEIWWRETYSRSYFKFFIRPYSAEVEVMSTDPQPPDMYLVCDCDEIPDRDVLQQLRTNGAFSPDISLDVPLHFNMYIFFYNFQWLMKSDWSAPYMISSKGLFQLPGVSHPRYSRGQVVGNGWHCSYFMSIDKMIQKIEAFSHQELNTDANKDREYIQQCLREGLDLYRRTPEDGVDFHKLSNEYLQDTLPVELYDFHVQVQALQHVA